MVEIHKQYIQVFYIYICNIILRADEKLINWLIKAKYVWLRGIAGGGGVSWGARDPPLVAFFWANDLQYSGSKNAMTISWP